MKIKIGKSLFLFLSMFLITLSNAQLFINNGFYKIIEYLGFAIILVGIYFRKDLWKYQKKLILLFVIMVFFSIGLFMQNLSISKLVSLVLSMFILASFAIMPCNYIQSLDSLKTMSRGVFTGLIVSTFLALVTGIPIVTYASEGLFVSFGFNGGLEHRNYLSYAVLTILISEFILYRNRKCFSEQKWILISIILIIATNSRSSYILLFLFITISNYDKIRFSKYSKSLPIGVAIISLILIGIPAYRFLTTVSETFFFRTNGLTNYLNMYRDDGFHMIFGNAEMAFKDTGMTYDENIRSVIGWDGSTELVILNVLIKNGLLGFVGYFIIFRHYFKELERLKITRIKVAMLSILITFIISAFVESYVANIHYTYTVYCYLVLCNMKKLEIQLTERDYSYENDCVLSSSIPYNS